jgi:Tol biopolymer transport system component
MRMRLGPISHFGLPIMLRRRWRSLAGGGLMLAVASLVVAALGGAQQLTPVMVELISVSINGTSGNAASNGVAANVDGSVVAFYSDATDLIRGDTNQTRDVFVRDRASQVTERVSVSSDGEPGNRPSHARGFPPAIDGDGRIVAFYSDATNLVPDDTNGQSDVFVRLRNTGTTERVSLGTDGTQGNGPSLNPSIDAAGQLVAFQSQASNFVPNDQNGLSDIFVRDRGSATTERVCDSVEPNGSSSTPSISADGQFVAFTSAATNLVPGVPDANGRLDIFVCDRASGAIDLVSVSSQGVQGNGDSILPAISKGGRFVAFKSLASNLVPDDRNNLVDVFVRDRELGTTERISVNFLGGDSNDVSFPPSISYDGRYVAFGSAANNLVRADVNGLPSVFVRDRMFNLSLLVDVNALGQQANGATPDVPPSVSGDGMQIGYVSFASNLTANPDRNETSDVFIAGNPFFCPTGICPDGLMCVGGMCVPEVVPTSTPTPTLGPSDCCQCAGNTCTVPSDGTCPTDCNPVRQAACLDTGRCATFTPVTATATPTGTPGANDCCQCAGNTCVVPSDGMCPADCDLVRQAACLQSGACATFTPTPTATASATPGPNDCCQCAGNTCAVPSDGMCPVDCDLVRQAACLQSGTCATFTPTPTATASATPGPKDCCQCAGNTCAVPSDGMCPADCDLVRQAACLQSGTCATFTPTPTATASATPGPNDCCQCAGNTCAVPSDGMCPVDCDLVRQAACLQSGTCATFTPTPTATASATPGPNDCCQCAGNTCAVPSDGMCPADCDLVRQAACLQSGACATFTPTASATPTGPTVTPTPTVGANDCCQCEGNSCVVPSDGTCPTGCEPVRQAACLSSGACATFTPVGPTPTATPSASASPTRTQTPPATATQTPGTPGRPLDRDACQCAVSPNPQRTRRGVVLWLSGPVLLLVRRFRRRRSG